MNKHYKVVPVDPDEQMIHAACQDGVCIDGKPVWKRDVAFQALWKYQQMIKDCPDFHTTKVTTQVDQLLQQAKLIIYILTASVVKVSPNYFSEEVFNTLSLSEKDIQRGLQELDEDVSIDDLMIALFQKERLH